MAYDRFAAAQDCEGPNLRGEVVPSTQLPEIFVHCPGGEPLPVRGYCRQCKRVVTWDDAKKVQPIPIVGEKPVIPGSVTRKFRELFLDYVIKTEDQKIRNHTHDDFCLGYRYHFAGGYYNEVGDRNVWTNLYAVARSRVEEEFFPSLVSGEIGGFSLKYAPTDATLIRERPRIMLCVTDRTMIGGGKLVCDNVVDIPEELEPFVKGD